MKYSDVRYSITLREAQIDYLLDDSQVVKRTECLKTFLHMAAIEPATVKKKGFSAGILPGQFIASKVELAELWNCDRKTATRIVREFNLMGILRSVPTNRTTIHTLLCLSAWFTNHKMIRSSFFTSSPMVRPLEKPVRKIPRVPPESAVKTAGEDKLNASCSAGTHTAALAEAETDGPSGTLLPESDFDD